MVLMANGVGMFSHAYLSSIRPLGGSVYLNLMHIFYWVVFLVSELSPLYILDTSP